LKRLAKNETWVIHTDYPQVLGELFHALNQPLTILRCSLALLLKDSTTARVHRRRELQVALRQAESVAWLTSCIRDLVDAGNPGTSRPGVDGQSSDLTDCLREIAAEWGLVAQSRRVRLRMVAGSPCHVPLEAGRLRQACILLLDFVIASARAGSEISLRTCGENHGARVFIQCYTGKGSTGSTCNKRALTRKVQLAIAQRIFESSAGRFQISQAGRQLSITIHLPYSSQEPALPLGRSFRRPA
jgi:K+-sensing histidine kinase KdpD